MSKKKLYYFDTFGLGESIRYLLHYGGIKFEDIHYTLETFPKDKLKFPYGQLPVYEDGNKRLHQSLAIARYLGTTLKLITGDAFEDARLDALACTFYDFWLQVVAYFKETDSVKKAELKRKIEIDLVEFYFPKFESEIDTKSGYFAGKLTWIDFVFVGLIEATNHFFGGTIEKNHPALSALVKKVLNIPNVKAYIANRKAYTL